MQLLLDERDSHARLVDLPNIELFIFVQILVKLVRRVSLSQNMLTCLNKLQHSISSNHALSLCYSMTL